MKIVLFNSYLSDGRKFVEISICDYSYKRDGVKMHFPYIGILDVVPADAERYLNFENDLEEVIKFVKFNKFNVDELETLKVNCINKIEDLMVRFEGVKDFIENLDELIQAEKV